MLDKNSAFQRLGRKKLPLKALFNIERDKHQNAKDLVRGTLAHVEARNALSANTTEVGRNAEADSKLPFIIHPDREKNAKELVAATLEQVNRRNQQTIIYQRIAMIDMSDQDRAIYIQNRNLQPGQLPISNATYKRNDEAMKFKTSVSVGAHIFARTEPVWLCRKCGEAFSETERNEHEAKVCGIRETLHCEVCRCPFYSIHSLELHVQKKTCQTPELAALAATKDLKRGSRCERRDIYLEAGKVKGEDVPCDHYDEGCSRWFKRQKNGRSKTDATAEAAYYTHLADVHNDKVHYHDFVYRKCTAGRNQATSCSYCDNGNAFYIPGTRVDTTHLYEEHGKDKKKHIHCPHFGKNLDGMICTEWFDRGKAAKSGATGTIPKCYHQHLALHHREAYHGTLGNLTRCTGEKCSGCLKMKPFYVAPSNPNS